jgi:hypothetical protein
VSALIRKFLKNMGRLFSILLFAVVFSMLFSGLGGISSGSTQEGVDITREAIERAAIVAYASEGFYPPSLRFIEENYNLQIDHNRFLVRYEVFASNIMPFVSVTAMDGEGGFQ